MIQRNLFPLLLSAGLLAGRVPGLAQTSPAPAAPASEAVAAALAAKARLIPAATAFEAKVVEQELASILGILRDAWLHPRDALYGTAAVAEMMSAFDRLKAAGNEFKPVAEKLRQEFAANGKLGERQQLWRNLQGCWVHRTKLPDGKEGWVRCWSRSRSQPFNCCRGRNQSPAHRSAARRRLPRCSTSAPGTASRQLSRSSRCLA